MLISFRGFKLHALQRVFLHCMRWRLIVTVSVSRRGLSDPVISVVRPPDTSYSLFDYSSKRGAFTSTSVFSQGLPGILNRKPRTISTRLLRRAES